MAALDWINPLFQGGEQTRGLSGAEASTVALDQANSFYNFRLRRHYSDHDLVEQPRRIWFTSDDPLARTGLGQQVAESLAEGQRYSDLMVILSVDDWARGAMGGPGWTARITDAIRAAHAELLGQAGLGVPERPLQVWIVAEGSEEIGGAEFGLVEGEFITGLVPNLYRGPGPSSRALLALHVNLPGVWEGYREVGRLYDDQVLLTLGNHWLDNFSHPALEEAALYRLQRDENGSFFHIINPDLQDRYQMASTDQDGTSVITLATRDGRPLAYLILAVLEEEPVDLPPDDFEFEAAPAIAPPMLLEEEPVNVDAARPMGGKTILPDVQQERIFTLQERGALLQKVHFSAFMLGYDVFVGHRGELGTAVRSPSATFQVRKRTVSVLANVDGIRVDGELLPAGESRLIEGSATIEVGSQRLEYADLRNVGVDGWPYVGEIRRPASSTYMLWGRSYTVGRSRECRVVLPDEPQNDNIVWKPKVGDGATIRSKTGEIPKSRFYTDSIMVASEHASVELVDDQPVLVCRARHCYGFIRRHAEVMSLYPSEAGKLPVRMPLEPGDEVLIGNCLFHASFTPTGEVAIAPAPAPAVSTESLTDFVPEPDFDDLDAPMPPSVDNREDDEEFLVEVEPEPLELDISMDNLPVDVDDLEPPPIPRLAEPEETFDYAPETFQVFADSPVRRDPAPMVEVAVEEEDEPPTVQFSAAAFTDAAPDEPPDPAMMHEPTVTLRVEGTPITDSAMFPDDDAWAGEVAVVDDQAAMFELGRPARFVLVGWAVNGSVVCGNFEGCDLLIPENRISKDQLFEQRTYFRLKIRGRKGRLDPVDLGEMRVDGGDASDAGYDNVDSLEVEVIRRDDTGEEDFSVPLRVVADRKLPDPRARLVSIDHEEPLVEALFTVGVPLRAEHAVRLNGLDATVIFDGSSCTIRDYLGSYRRDGGFSPFFVQREGTRFKTAPEDGSPIELQSGDRIVFGAAVYQFTVA
jgi:hypothetical protein